ncbi:small multi-drug export protein [Candidatus Woesearchaeota archaeon]|nr:small multi-drug export protein [Candidatus Woesearchaeota archaeon]
MIEEIIILVLMTLLPFLELRASIPWGILKLGMDPWLVFAVCVVANILLAPLIWLFINYVMQLFLKIKAISKLYDKMVVRTQKKVKPYVEKYGKLGLAVFIGIPLPGSGVYSGGLGGYLLGFKFKDYMIASVIGVLIAGILVLIASVSGLEIFRLFIKVG